MTMIVDTARIAPFPAGFWPCSSLTKARLKVLQVHYSLNVAHCVEHHVQFADSSAVVKKLMALATLELTPSRSWQKALISIFACASTELQCFSVLPLNYSAFLIGLQNCLLTTQSSLCDCNHQDIQCIWCYPIHLWQQINQHGMSGGYNVGNSHHEKRESPIMLQYNEAGWQK